MKKKSEVKAVLYMRVGGTATDHRSKSIAGQKESLSAYCEKKGIKILKAFEDIASGKNFNRPGWKELLVFLSENKESNSLLLVTHFDRCTRNFLGAIQIVEMLNKMGIKLIETETGKDITRVFKQNSIPFILSNVELKIK
ncbi:MAG TPA: recombinase family protein [Bacteroidia bacterium]|nr:recombinase family protein [Bacteroidia bacterium]